MQKFSKINVRYVVPAIVAVLASVLFAPIAASAQVTIKHVRVTVTQAAPNARTSVYCDTGTGCAASGGNEIWDVAHGFTTNGVVLAAGQTLVLAQTGNNAIPPGGGNFDTSDSVQKDGSTQDCTPSIPCSVKVEIDSGGKGGFVTYTGSGLLNLVNNNTGGSNNEASQYSQVPTTGVLYTLAVGYADSLTLEHTGPCTPILGTGNPCFPSPFNGTLGTTPASKFVGAGVAGLSEEPCTSNGDNGAANCFDGGAILITAVSSTEGRMTGGGSVFDSAGTRFTHGFELHCSILNLPNTLEINWDGGNNFHLDALTSVTCTDDPLIAPPPPNAGFDTLTATGTGTLNGSPASISFVLTDAGEPGTKDTAMYVITQGTLTVTVPTANLDKGNQQAHKN